MMKTSFTSSPTLLKSLEFTFEERERITQALIIGQVKCKNALDKAVREKAGADFINHQTTWLAEVQDALELFRVKDKDGEFIR